MASPDGTLAVPLNTIGATKYISQRPKWTAFSKLLNFPHNFPVPKSSSADTAVSAACSLTDTLANPRPAPFTQIGDAQLQAFKKVVCIFDYDIQQATAVPPSMCDARPALILAAPPRVPVHTVPSLRVPVSIPPPRVPQSPTPSRIPIRRPPPNIIELDHDDPAAHRYPLRLQHSLSAATPRRYAGIKPRYVDALHHLITQEQANVVIDEITVNLAPPPPTAPASPQRSVC